MSKILSVLLLLSLAESAEAGRTKPPAELLHNKYFSSIIYDQAQIMDRMILEMKKRCRTNKNRCTEAATLRQMTNNPNTKFADLYRLKNRHLRTNYSLYPDYELISPAAQLEQSKIVIKNLYIASLGDLSKDRTAITKIYTQWEERTKSEYSKLELLPYEDISQTEDRLLELFRREMEKRGIIWSEKY